MLSIWKRNGQPHEHEHEQFDNKGKASKRINKQTVVAHTIAFAGHVITQESGWHTKIIKLKILST